LSRTSAGHRKPPRSSRSGPGAASRPRKFSGIGPWFKDKPALIAAAVVAGVLALVSGWPAAAHWMAGAANTAWSDEADALGLQAAVKLGAQASQQPEIVSSGIAVTPHYLNPLRDIAGLVLERIDQGTDFSGSGPVYALGDGIVTSSIADDAGWSGGWITYQLTDGPAQGLEVYVAEDVTPTVQVGQAVTAYTVVGNMFDGSEGIETGWAQPGGANAESQLAVAGGLGGLGPFPTCVGYNFDELLISVGVSPAPNFGQTCFGILPPNYPTAWG
jgi:murein DD-endopeptidase MepM/ murein hydrolase activator NlpD